MQCGTAREIIANPVSEYVADFVAHMNPLGVLTARDVMSAGEDAADRAVTAETPVKQVMEMLRDGAGTLAVTEGAARIGSIRATDLLARLLDPRGAS